jgi:hypothetical protein
MNKCLPNRLEFANLATEFTASGQTWTASAAARAAKPTFGEAPA